MTLTEALQYYGGRENMTEATGYSSARIRLWIFRGFIPLRAQLQMQVWTEGHLVASE